MKKGDYMLIEFSHNAQKLEDNTHFNPYSAYEIANA